MSDDALDAGSFDWIVVGTGSAGSVLAARLSEQANHRVLVLEAGGMDRNPFIHIPAGYTRTLNGDAVNWRFEIDPEDYTHNRVMPLPRGKVVGGSSSINGMLYVRGNARDFDDWAQMGNRGWSWDEVLPFFRKSERREGGDPAFRGASGPLTVSDMRDRSELADDVIRAGEQLGYPRNPDYNGASQDGFAYFQVCQKAGLRQSAFRAFLKPALKRPNIELRTHAMVERVVIEDGRAVAVDYRRGGRLERAAAGRGIVLSAGAVQSPQLLELSGIGDPEVLRAQGIPVRMALPGVGENYRDHYMVRMSWRVTRPITLNERSRGLSFAGEVLRYAFRRRGLLTTPPGVVAGFVRTRDDLAAPDVQYHIVHASYDDPHTKALSRTPGMTIGAYQTRPESAGAIHIRSPRADEQPSIRGNYLASDYDRRALVGGMRIARALMDTEVMRRHIAFEQLPGPEVETDEQWLGFAREAGQAIYHPVGTCRMGADPLAVVDPRLCVHGVPGLRVADASIMPTLTNGNTHAPTMMIAEKAAHMMLEDERP